MTAPLLLEALRERGARVSVVQRDGSPVLLVVPRGIVGDLAGDVARFKPSLVELLQTEQLLLDGADECPLEFLRRLRNAGVSLQLSDVAHAGDETGEIADDGPPLVWHLPENWSDTLKRDTAARLQQHSEAIAERLEFERWHWSACANYFNFDGKRTKEAPVGLPYRDWAQFARFQVGSQTANDLRDLARFILERQQTTRADGAVFHYGHIKIAWRVVAALADRQPSTGDLVRWAELVVGGETR